MPFPIDAQTLLSDHVLTLVTTAGELDLLAVVEGVGAFADVERLAEVRTPAGFEVFALGIEGL